MKVLSFEEWRASEVAARAGTVVDCPVCHGDPDYRDEWGGEDDDEVCWRCDGDLRLLLEDLFEFEVEINDVISPDKYVRALAVDLVALAVWRNTSPIELLVEEGFTPLSTPDWCPEGRGAAVICPSTWPVAVDLCSGPDPWRRLASNA